MSIRADGNLRESEEHRRVVWLNLVGHQTTLVELEAFCAAARKAGAGSNQYVTYVPSPDGPSERLTLTVPMPPSIGRLDGQA